MTRPIIVAIDGPAGAGKSTVSKILARRLNFSLVDTGAIYRCVALAARERHIGLEDDATLDKLLPELSIAFLMQGENNQVYLDGQNVSLSIRTPENSMAASKVSARPGVRAGLLELQRRLALKSKRGAILEGRDIGTVVFPDADLKFFLDADPKIRAQRRYEEQFQKGTERTLQEVQQEQEKRDKQDSEREHAPLKPADDAVRLDSTALPISEVVHRIEQAVLERLAKK